MKQTILIKTEKTLILVRLEIFCDWKFQKMMEDDAI